MRRFALVVGLFLVVYGWSVAIPPVQAQPYPNHPIQLVIPGAAGLMQDIPGRLLSEEVGKLIKPQIVVLNKPGASMTLARTLWQRVERMVTHCFSLPRPLFLSARF